MVEPIMVGCDLHDQTLLLRVGRGRGAGETMAVRNSRAGRAKLIERLGGLAREAGGARIVFAYEASGQGFGLYDELTEAGIECHVLAPTKIARSSQQAKLKTDEKDAEQILELLRGHELAGNRLPSVWIPDARTRDDRELVRTRLDVAEKAAGLKTQVRCLLKRCRLDRPESVGSGWTRGFEAWLKALVRDERLGAGTREALASLLRQLASLEQELKRLDRAVLRLSRSERYAGAMAAMTRLSGVGVLTALVFLTEVGDMRRFKNRRQISAYLGLIPQSRESGTRNDCKGHITRQGPSRVRKVLCQATWARVRHEGPAREAYQRIVERNPQHKKIAVVACMRRLAILMWHRACDAPPIAESKQLVRRGHSPAPAG